ncbi:MAG TPA: DUF4491 family protein [Anaerolineales bacterium]|nr:DUF4491 family protein [Anaerolineales bacterium]
MNFLGPTLGIATLLIIGLGFIWVIRGERYFGYLWWPYVMGFGLMLILASIFVSSPWVSALLGAFGASLLWGSTELKEQAIRAEVGWYPFNAGKILPPFAKFIAKWKAPHL